MRITPIRLAPKDAERYVALRKQMLADSPWAFSANPDDDVALDSAFLHSTLAQPDNAIMAIAGDKGHGLGRAVTSAALELAKTWKGVTHIDVRVSENSPAALRIYQSLGFVEWGREPESTQHGGQRYDEIFLSLRVTQSAGA